MARGKYVELSNSQIKRFAIAWTAGVSVKDIGERFAMTGQTVQNVAKRLELPERERATVNFRD